MFEIIECTTNHRTGHIVIGDNKVIFGWKMESDEKNICQEAYEIKLYNYDKNIIWNSGKVNSNKSINILYPGNDLTSRKEYYWDVKVWNNKNEIAESELISFETGLNSEEDWKARWIESHITVKSIKEEFRMDKIFSYHSKPVEIEELKLDSPIVFLKEFNLKDKKVKKARLYITSHGVYEASLNSKKIGDEYLAPGFTTYPKLQYYQTHDITEFLKEDINRIEVIVADGWYKGRIGLAGIGHQFGDKVALLAQIEIEYVDGEISIIGTDNSVKSYIGDLEYSDLFIGEKQNHIKKKKKYFDVNEIDYGYKQLKVDTAEPITIIESFKAVKIINTPLGETIIDFGRNIAGIVEVKAKGKSGDVIQLQHAEELTKEGNFFFNIVGQNKYQTTTYILGSSEYEIFKPKFTYQGFRYVKVLQYPGEIDINNFTAHVLSTSCKRTGYVKTSNEKINKLIENIYHSQESNFISVPTDCPQREKGGWTGDAQIYTPTAIFNMKIDNFMNRWLENMRLDQYENGQVPGLIPWIESDDKLSVGFGNVSAAGWADACIIIPYHLYIQYEDINYLTDNYEMMKKWITYVEHRCASNITDELDEDSRYIWDMDFHYGDWLTPSLVNEDGSPNPMLSAKLTANQVATMYFAYSTQLLSEISKILCKNDDAIYYKNLSKKIKSAFNKVFVNENGIIEGDLQGLYVLATNFEMSSEEINKKFIARLVQKINDNGQCLDTGFLSTPILLDTLSKYGYRDLAYKLLLQENYPSWLYQVNKGATTIWESWNAILEDGTRNITSYNHYSLGSVQDFIVRELVGFKKAIDEGGVYIINPDFKSPFNSCSLSYESPYGQIKLQWNLKDGSKRMRISIPVGVKIRLVLENKNMSELGSGAYEIDI